MIEGLFEGNTPSDLQAAQNWLGVNVGAVTAFTGQANWSDYVSSVGYEQGLWSGAGKTVLWSIPLFANGGNLHDAGAGAYDSYFTAVADQLVAGQSSGSIYVRTGWEFNGSWETWSAINDPTDYIAAYRDFVTAFRAVSDRFVFTWAPNIGDQGMNPAAAYPGDQYVDIIGMDVYQQGASNTFSQDLTETYGLQWLTSFAAEHGKPIAIPEWGVDSDTSSAYVASAAAWMVANNVTYESYWDSDAAYSGKLSNGDMPDTGAAFITALGAPVGITLTPLNGNAVNDAQARSTLTVGGTTTNIANGTTVTLDVSQNGGPAVAHNVTVENNAFSLTSSPGSGRAFAAGSYVITASVTDANGVTPTPASETITVAPQPTIAFIPVYGNNIVTSAQAEQSITINGTTTNIADGTNVTVDISQNGGAAIPYQVMIQKNGYSVTLTPPSGGFASGSYAVSASVTDANGVTPTPASETLTVRSASSSELIHVPSLLATSAPPSASVTAPDLVATNSGHPETDANSVSDGLSLHLAAVLEHTTVLHDNVFGHLLS